MYFLAWVFTADAPRYFLSIVRYGVGNGADTKDFGGKERNSSVLTIASG